MADYGSSRKSKNAILQPPQAGLKIVARSGPLRAADRDDLAPPPFVLVQENVMNGLSCLCILPLPHSFGSTAGALSPPSSRTSCRILPTKRRQADWIPIRASFEQGGGGGEGVLDPKLGVPKMA